MLRRSVIEGALRGRGTQFFLGFKKDAVRVWVSGMLRGLFLHSSFGGASITAFCAQCVEEAETFNGCQRHKTWTNQLGEGNTKK